MTRFLIESNDAVKKYFKLADGDKADALYKINDVYDQIERIVENVSYDICMISYCIKCYTAKCVGLKMLAN